MINAKIDQKDLAKLARKMEALKKISKQEMSNELGRTAFDISRLAKRSAPVDKSNLRSLIGVKPINTNQIEIFSNAIYSAYVEFGTGARVSLSDMLKLGIPESYAAQFKGKGIKDVNLPARPYFFSSARTGLQNLLQRLDNKIKKATK